MLSNVEPAIGKLLISEPFLIDPNFRRSVILITDYQPEGTLGFIINHASSLLLKDLVPEMPDADFPVYIGGPVATDSIHFLHRCYDKLLDGIEVAKGIYWGGNFEALKVLISNGSIKPYEVKFFIGYSGWAPNQLKEEIDINTWIVSNQYHQDIVFSNNEEELWREVIVNLGPKYAHVSNFPIDPRLN